jgi:hypothetical protein
MLGIIYNLFAVPYNFLIGFVVGVVTPVAAVAAMVFGVRLLTGKMPFLSLRTTEEGAERRLSLELVPEEEAAELYAIERDKVMDELGGLRDEMKAMMEEAKAKAEEEAA